METFTALLAICAGNSLVPGEFPAQIQCRGALILSFICVWINGWVIDREAGDLGRYRAHYDVIAFFLPGSHQQISNCWQRQSYDDNLNGISDEKPSRNEQVRDRRRALEK